VPQFAPTRLLLVEDDAAARNSLSQILIRNGYQVATASSGAEALALLEASAPSEPFAVVLTDLLLGDGDGIAVLRRARELPDPPEVILLTSYGTMQTAIESLRSGAFDYLLKPTKPDELLRTLERAVQRRAERMAQDNAMRLMTRSRAQQGETGPPGSAEGEADEIRVGALLLNRRTRSVAFQGQPLALTPTEFALLLCLADAGGAMLTYSEIARRVYRHAGDEASAHQLLKTHIHNLRRKLSPAYIVNVRSTGYRLVDPG